MKNIKLRQECLDLFKQGLGNKEIARRVKRNFREIQHLRAHYNRFGEQTFLAQKGRVMISAEQKRKIVKEYLEDGLSLNALSLKYDLSMGGIKAWITKVNTGGYESLSDTIYGKRKGMARPKKQHPVSPELLEDYKRIKRENELLRTENALLKKLKALAEEKEARLKEMWQTPLKG